MNKMYYSINEVSKILSLKPYVLRYWEKEFVQINPRKHRGNRRMYTKKDINTIKMIKYLLYERGFTIKGAQKFLKEKENVKQLKLEFEKSIDKKTIMKEILEIIKILRG